MALACSICTHSSRGAINDLLAHGTSVRDVAGRFGISKSAVSRHAQHLPAELAAGVRLEREESAGETVSSLRELADVARSIMNETKQTATTRLKAIRELTRLCELISRVNGEIDSAPSVNVSISESPEAREFMLVVLATLTPYPDARAALLQKLSATGWKQ